MVATSQSIGFGLALLGVAYALCGIIPALFILEKMHDPYAKQTLQEAQEVIESKEQTINS